MAMHMAQPRPPLFLPQEMSMKRTILIISIKRRRLSASGMERAATYTAVTRAVLSAWPSQRFQQHLVIVNAILPRVPPLIQVCDGVADLTDGFYQACDTDDDDTSPSVQLVDEFFCDGGLVESTVKYLHGLLWFDIFLGLCAIIALGFGAWNGKEENAMVGKPSFALLELELTAFYERI